MNKELLSKIKLRENRMAIIMLVKIILKSL